MNSTKAAAFRQGLIVLAALAALTAVEYLLGLRPGFTLPLVAIALIKAGLVAQYFMHIYRLWAEEAH